MDAVQAGSYTDNRGDSLDPGWLTYLACIHACRAKSFGYRIDIVFYAYSHV